MVRARFFAALVVLLAAVVLQLGVPLLIPGTSVDFALAALIAVALFLAWREFVPLVFLGMWFLNWQPVLRWELVWFGTVPLLLFFIGRISPLERWLTALLSLVIGILFFYALPDYRFFSREWLAVLRAAVPGVGFGAFVFLLFDFLYGSRRES